jgi:hypothetical protein
MLYNTENIALQCLQILYTFVLHAKIAIQKYTKFANFGRLYFLHILQHFATKLCSFTNFSMPFPGIYFFAKIKN